MILHFIIQLSWDVTIRFRNWHFINQIYVKFKIWDMPDIILILGKYCPFFPQHLFNYLTLFFWQVDRVQTSVTTIFLSFWGFFSINALDCTKMPQIRKYLVRGMSLSRKCRKNIFFSEFCEKSVAQTSIWHIFSRRRKVFLLDFSINVTLVELKPTPSSAAPVHSVMDIHWRNVRLAWLHLSLFGQITTQYLS